MTTPASAVLAAAGIDFEAHEFEAEGRDYGKAAAAALGVDEERVFKTLMVELDSRPAVGIVPVAGMLSLRSFAAALGGKRAVMMEPATAERTTGYVVGGISPFGQRRRSPTVLDASAMTYKTIYVSGGRRGLDLEVAPHDLVRVLSATVAAIATD